MTAPSIPWLIGDTCIGCHELIDLHAVLPSVGGMERLHCRNCRCADCGEGA